MGSRMGTRLPMIFVKGHPAKLHEMTLNQLRKFVPFLVKCETRKELPLTTDKSVQVPDWWPPKLPFSRTVLYDKRSQKEMTQRLVRIVSRCYSQHDCSYLIAFSTSLAGGNGSQSFGKLNMVELADGTTRIMNAKGQLVVVVRTTTRHYDKEDSREGKKRRRSARLVPTPDRTGQSRERPATDFKGSKQSPLADEDDERETKRQRRNVERTCRKPNGVILAENVRNQIPQDNERKPKDKVKVKIARPQRAAPKEEEKVRCKYCNKAFKYQEFLDEHEISCGAPEDDFADVRDDDSKKGDFLTCMGLTNTSNNLTLPVEERVVEDKPVPRNLRKVASRSKIGALIRAHPLPLTSKRGQALLDKFGERMKPESFEDKRLENEKSCKSRKYRVPEGPAPTICTLKKNIIKANQYVHKYSFSRRERIRRDVELTVGLSRSSFKLYNRCRSCAVVMERLDKEVEEKYLEKRRRELRAKQIRFEKYLKVITPTLTLYDFKLYPETLPRPYQNIVHMFS